MLCNHKVIGGYSFPNEDLFGAFYSIDGKTMELITGVKYPQWIKAWEKRYSE